MEKQKHIGDNVYNHADACDSTGAECKDGDKVFKDRADNIAVFGDLTTKLTDYGNAVTPYIVEYDKQVTADSKRDNAKLAVDALGKAYTDDETNKKTASSQAVVARQALKDATDKSVTNAQADCTTTDNALAAKELELGRLKNNEIVAKHISELAKDKFDNLTSLKDMFKRASDHAAAQKALANTSYLRTVAHMKVY